MIIQNGKTFHLKGKGISYVMYIGEHGDLLQYHFGERIAERDYSGYKPSYEELRSYGPQGECGLENALQEYPAYGHVDLRTPAYAVINADGNAVSRLKYKSHKIYDGKYAVDGMPSVYEGSAHAQTLEITLCDEIAGFDTILYYSVFDEYDIITRSAKFVAHSEISITRSASACLDLRSGDYDAVYFSGEWARERELQRSSINNSTTLEISNARGGSGHYINPFVMVCEPCADETHGKVYGFSLIYSGDHAAFVSRDTFGRVRVQHGINPQNFEWTLACGEEFATPECVMCFSANGFEHISHNYHDLYRNNLCRSKWANLDRPILINNWEGTYFDFNEEKLLAIAEAGAKAGCELFVLDDGWFGKRDDDTSSLGDWKVNIKKLPCGIDGLAQKVNDMGMKFGLWFEPEMVNPDSDLFRAHPDWAIQVPNRPYALGRNQLILDLSRADVRDYVVKSVSDVLSGANISYVKWDMNRYMSDRPCMGYNHKYTLGLYDIMDRICGAFPDVLFEGCAAGGGRFDPGILAYMPQIWTSDNSDAVSRLKIQYSTSMAYPMSAISAHITAVPNHQTGGRVSSLEFRADVAMTGSFGYELDPTALSSEELEQISKQIKRYKTLRTLLRTGDFYRLENPYEGENCAWMTVAKDKSEAVVFRAQRLMQPCGINSNLMLRGLDADALYENVQNGEAFYGSELMNVGLDLQINEHDFNSELVVFKRK